MKPRVFTRIVRGWLREILYGYCTKCCQAVPLDKMLDYDPHIRRHSPWCNACNAAKVLRYRREHPETDRRWREQNKDKTRLYWRRRFEKNREKFRKRARINYAKRCGGRLARSRVAEYDTVFEARCVVCGKEFLHEGTRTTCSDACRLKKLIGGRKVT